MNRGNLRPLRLGEMIEMAALATPRKMSVANWLAIELGLATGERISARQARRYFDQARAENRVPRECLGPLLSIIYAALRFTEDRVQQAIADLEAAEDGEEATDAPRLVADHRRDPAAAWLPEKIVASGR
jgi:hypothetical protein